VLLSLPVAVTPNASLSTVVNFTNPVPNYVTPTSHATLTLTMFPTLVTMDPPTPAPDPDPDPDTPEDDDDSILTYFSGSAISCPDIDFDDPNAYSAWLDTQTLILPFTTSDATLTHAMIPTLVTMDPPTPAPDPDPDPDTPEDDDDVDTIFSDYSGSWLSCCPDLDDPDSLSAWITQTLILPFTLELDEALPEEALSHGVHGSLLYLPAAAAATPFSSKGLLTSNEIPASDTLLLLDPPPDTIHDARPDAKPPPFLPPTRPLTGAVTPPSTLSLTNKPTSVDPTPDHTPTARPAAKPPHAPASTWFRLWCLRTLPVPLKFPLDLVQ
jgi:hypothetical protein